MLWCLFYDCDIPFRFTLLLFGRTKKNTDFCTVEVIYYIVADLLFCSVGFPSEVSCHTCPSVFLGFPSNG